MTRFSHLTSRNFLIALHDVLATALAYLAAFYLRFDGGEMFYERLPLLLHILPYFLVFSVVVSYVFNLTTTKWRFISLPDGLNILRVATVLALTLVVLDYILVAPNVRGTFFVGKVTIILFWFLEVSCLSALRFAYRYFKTHYWDGVDFTDARLIRTPIFEPRLDKYFRDLVPPQADSIEREADMLLLQARVNKPMFQFLMVYFVQKYVNPEYMGQDAVFVHLFEKYINTGEAEFFTEKYRKFLNDRAYSLMANLIGQPAANMEMVDTAGTPRPLYGIDAPFVVICFWDPTCSHCKETVPKVDSIFQAKWKKEGVKLYGVMVDGGREAWLQFIKDHNLTDWVHVYETREHADSTEKAGQPSFRQLYDVYQTPILYLLDKDKRIIAKKLSYQQLDQVIDLKLRQKKSD